MGALAAPLANSAGASCSTLPTTVTLSASLSLAAPIYKSASLEDAISDGVSSVTNSTLTPRRWPSAYATSAKYPVRSPLASFIPSGALASSRATASTPSVETAGVVTRTSTSLGATSARLGMRNVQPDKPAMQPHAIATATVRASMRDPLRAPALLIPTQPCDISPAPLCPSSRPTSPSAQPQGNRRAAAWARYACKASSQLTWSLTPHLRTGAFAQPPRRHHY